MPYFRISERAAGALAGLFGRSLLAGIMGAFLRKSERAAGAQARLCGCERSLGLAARRDDGYPFYVGASEQWVLWGDCVDAQALLLT